MEIFHVKSQFVCSVHWRIYLTYYTKCTHYLESKILRFLFASLHEHPSWPGNLSPNILHRASVSHRIYNSPSFPTPHGDNVDIVASPSILSRHSHCPFIITASSFCSALLCHPGLTTHSSPIEQKAPAGITPSPHSRHYWPRLQRAMTPDIPQSLAEMILSQKWPS